MDSSIKINEKFQLAFDYVNFTGRNVFLTGKAGTGKTTFLKYLKAHCLKRMIVTSPTGVAAVNAGGVTLHSFFQLPLGPKTPDSPIERRYSFNKQKLQIIRSLELLVIDEISMVRADLLDLVDNTLRRYRRNNKPFGGVQLLLIGDMQQLSPVIKQEEIEILSPYYSTYYFFGSKAWQSTEYVCIELDEVFRQTDDKFLNILNSIREAKTTNEILNELNKRYIPNFTPPQGEDIVTLVTTNRQAEKINSLHLLELKTEKQIFEASVKGEFPESSYPVDKYLTLKVNSLVMFIKNDPSADKLYYNGKIGRVTKFGEDCVYVKCQGEHDEICVNAQSWENNKYEIDDDTKVVKETTIGTFKQIPLKVAWAVTIHKSQGLTFDKLMIDASNSFAHGQVYVALSRCRTLEGLILLSKLSAQDIINDPQMYSFALTVKQNMPNQLLLRAHRKDYFFDIVEELFDFTALYSDLQNIERTLLINSSSIYGTVHIFDKLDSMVLNELMSISDKFIKNIKYTYKDFDQNLDDEPTLISRIEKGCQYYITKLEQIVKPALMTFNLDSDDKAKRQRLLEVLTQLKDDYNYKYSILNSMKDGFSIRKYLSQKTKLSLEPNDEFLQKATTTFNNLQPIKSVTKNPELYSKLISWRSEKAAELNVEPKDLVATKLVIKISDEAPKNVNDLLNIKGMKGKLKQYSYEILKTILEITAPDSSENEELLRDAEFENLSTVEKSYKMYNEGKKVKEIAKERNLKEQTILGHLSQYVATDDINPLDLISSDKYEAIKMYITENPNQTEKDIIKNIDIKCNYGEIAVVRASLESPSNQDFI